MEKLDHLTYRDLFGYSKAHTSHLDHVLLELERETHLKELVPQMLSGHFQGKLLQMISSMIQPKYVLEIGTYTGFSAICMTTGLQEGGQLHTIEVNEELESMAKKYFEKANVQDKITLHIGDALEIITNIEATFDLVFIDAKKTEYINYYNLIFDKVRPGGFILTDNVLWEGKVLKEIKDAKTRAIVAFNKMVQEDDRVENILMPIRDGIMIAKKLHG